jgi:hypothetical protein
MSKKKAAKDEAAPRAAKSKSYKIAAGRSLSCATRILSGDDDVTADMLHPNPEAAKAAFAAHLEAGTIVEA